MIESFFHFNVSIETVNLYLSSAITIKLSNEVYRTIYLTCTESPYAYEWIYSESYWNNFCFNIIFIQI